MMFYPQYITSGTYDVICPIISDVTLIILLTSRKFTLFSLIKHFMGRYFEAI